MAENPKFNNIGMFKDVSNNTGHTDIDADNKSEVLATQGNVINSIKTFWNSLRRKLVYAITRTDTSKAVGNEYIPVYVDEDGEVKQCNGFKKDVSISNNNIIIDNLSLIVGTTLSLNVTSNINNPNNLLTINNQKVLYPTGVEVKAKIDANTNLLVVYNGADWILINKMNEAKTSGKTSASGAGGNGYSGLMTADDKAKLETIEWDANKYTLPTATSSKEGGVKLGAGKLTSLDTPSPTSNTGRYYPIQTDKNDKLVVNVPWKDTHEENWTADLKVGNANSTSNDATNGDQDTYIKVVENGQVHGKVKVVGSGDTKVSSNNNGELVISSPTVPSYSILSGNDSDSSKPYLIKGAGTGKINNSYVLAGNGNWVKVLSVPASTSSDSGKILKCGSDGKPYWANANE
jgi:hypothetical protein